MATYSKKSGFSITRAIAAPREDVWEAWTDPEQLRWFFSGQESPDETISVDLRVGGAWRLLMVVSDDLEYYTGGIYREITPTTRLVFSWGAVDGWPKIDPDNLDEVPLTTIELRDVPSGTELTLTASFPDHFSDERITEWIESGMREGWGMTLDRIVTKFD